MPRRHARRPEPELTAPEGGSRTVETHPDGDWVVRRITGSASTKAYRCPGCDQEIRPATPHVVAWPTDEDADGLGERRHWHTPCWAARDRRRPARSITSTAMIEIRSSTVLPAVREPVTLTTSDGLRLVGELASPEGRPTAATLVCLHPLPTAGGMMDSHVQRKASWRLPALAGVAVLRFNTRGTSSPAGTSDGTFDAGQRARAWICSRHLTLWLLERCRTSGCSAGRSGRDVTLQHGLDPRVVGAVLLSHPAVRTSDAADLDRWAQDGRPLVALVPELDDYLRPAEARQRFARVPQAEVIGVEGARHLWVGEPYVRRALDELVRVVVGPEAVPLPTTWDGPYETHQDLAPLA